MSNKENIVLSKEILDTQPPTPTMEPAEMLAAAFMNDFRKVGQPSKLLSHLITVYALPRYKTYEAVVEAGLEDGVPRTTAEEELELILQNPKWSPILKDFFRRDLEYEKNISYLAQLSGLSPDQLNPELVDAAVDFIYDRPSQDSSD